MDRFLCWHFLQYRTHLRSFLGQIDVAAGYLAVAGTRRLVGAMSCRHYCLLGRRELVVASSLLLMIPSSCGLRPSSLLSLPGSPCLHLLLFAWLSLRHP